MTGEPSKVAVQIEQRGEYWYVVVLNADGQERQERPFSSRAEANAFWLQEIARTKDQ